MIVLAILGVVVIAALLRCIWMVAAYIERKENSDGLPDWEPGQAFPQAWRYGAAEERARIVKLLRDEAQATTFPKTADALDLAADLIERSA